MTGTGSEEVVRRFVLAVNAHDPDAVGALLSSSHVLVDSLGRELAGRAAVTDAWREYFALFPDYRIETEVTVSDGDVVAVFGAASGAYAHAAPGVDASWRIPAAWRAVVVGGLIDKWQVYADNKPVYDILAASGGASMEAEGG